MVKALAAIGLACAATASLVAVPAAASTVLPNLPAAAYSLLVTASNPANFLQTNTSTTPGTLGTSVAGASAGAEAVGAVDQIPAYASNVTPGLAFVGASVGVNNGSGNAVGYATYYMEVLGPVGMVNVTMNYHGGIVATGNVNPGNTVGFFLAVNPASPGGARPGDDIDNSGNAIWAAQQVNRTSTGLQLLNGSTSATTTSAISSLGQISAAPTSESAELDTNTIYQITMEAYVNAFSTGAGTLDAYLDPTFVIAAGVSDPQDYSFAFSQGIANGVPEPASWAMMMIGFCGLGVMSYRRKRRIDWPRARGQISKWRPTMSPGRLSPPGSLGIVGFFQGKIDAL